MYRIAFYASLSCKIVPLFAFVLLCLLQISMIKIQIVWGLDDFLMIFLLFFANFFLDLIHI